MRLPAPSSYGQSLPEPGISVSRCVLPYVPLPDHSLGRAFFQKSDFERAVMHLQRAADLRPEDEAIASDLRGAKMRLQG